MTSITTLASLATAACAFPQGPAPIAPAPFGTTTCDSKMTRKCGGDGEPPCCYDKYTPGASCLNGKLSANGYTHSNDGVCGTIQGYQKQFGCSCPSGCTTGDVGGKGQCV